jgi:hypothetical protein
MRLPLQIVIMIYDSLANGSVVIVYQRLTMLRPIVLIEDIYVAITSTYTQSIATAPVRYNYHIPSSGLLATSTIYILRTFGILRRIHIPEKRPSLAF